MPPKGKRAGAADAQATSRSAMPQAKRSRDGPSCSAEKGSPSNGKPARNAAAGGGDSVESSVSSSASSLCRATALTPSEGSVDADAASGQVRVTADRAARSGFVSRLTDVAGQLPPDVRFTTEDGTQHAAHRLMLCAWSPVFMTMLKERGSEDVALHDVKSRHLSAMLAWMYGGTIQLLREDEEAAMQGTEERTAESGAASSSAVACCWLPLLELSCKWQIEELRDQICSAEAILLDDRSIVQAWETSTRLALIRLEARCQQVLLAQMARACSSDPIELTPFLQQLSPAQYRRLLASDDLRIRCEEQAFRLAVAYAAARWPDPAARTIGSASEEIDSVLSAVRWRLLPAQILAREVMLHPVVRCGCGPGDVRPSLLPALTDALQFQVLGADAHSLLAPIPPGCDCAIRPRRCYGGGSAGAATRAEVHELLVSELKYEDLSVGLKVCVVNSIPELRKLCSSVAPGAEIEVKWTSHMKSLAGRVGTITQFNDEARAVEIDGGWWFPYTALSLA